MKLHDLKPAPGSKRPKRRVGRGIGGKGGKTAGRGSKGQGARGTVSPRFEGGQTPIHRRTPKAKGNISCRMCRNIRRGSTRRLPIQASHTRQREKQRNHAFYMVI